MALNRLAVVLIGAAALVFALIFARELITKRDISREEWLDRPVRVLTYGTFVSAKGPAEIVFKTFENENRAKLTVVVANDVGLMLERLKSGGSFDAVIGLDRSILERARREFSWRTVVYEKTDWFEAPAALSDENFVAIDWSSLAFVGRRDELESPSKFDDLTDARFAKQFALSDPRATAPGFEFARWVKGRVGGGTRDWLRRFQPNVSAVTPSWTAAYGLFEHRQTRFVWTYLTSLAFHWGTQHDRAYVPLIFPEGHPVQVEFAAVPADCRACELGEKLVRTLLEPSAQEIVMKRNFMMPVRRGPERGTVFAELPQPKLVTPSVDGALEDWDAIFAH